jgi:hypothetical protein
MEIIAQLGSLLGLSFISGINLYATVAVVGLCTKYNLVQGLPPEFDVLANEMVIFVAVILYLVEFFADKVPGFDTLWDTIHTFIRPLGGAMMALIQVGDASPGLQVIVFMLGASLASAAHLTKAGTRLIVNTSPEPFSNIALSLGEDIGVVGLAYASLAHPELSFFITLGCLVIIALVLPLIFRIIRMFFRAFFFKIKCFLQRDAAWVASRTLPYTLDVFFDDRREADEVLSWTARGFTIRVQGSRRFSPVQVILTNKTVRFVYRKRLRWNETVIPLPDIRQVKSYPGLLLSRLAFRGEGNDWLVYVYEPLSRTIPQHSSSPSKALIHGPA